MTPAHKQTDPAKLPGQIVNPPEWPGNHDMMDDTAGLRPVLPGTVGEYAARKAKLDACERDRLPDTDANWKPNSDMPSGWDHV